MKHPPPLSGLLYSSKARKCNSCSSMKAINPQITFLCVHKHCDMFHYYGLQRSPSCKWGKREGQNTRKENEEAKGRQSRLSNERGKLEWGQREGNRRKWCCLMLLLQHFSSSKKPWLKGVFVVGLILSFSRMFWNRGIVKGEGRRVKYNHGASMLEKQVESQYFMSEI